MYHNIRVEHLETKKNIFCNERTFIVTKNGTSRRLTQLHFTRWPDHGVPSSPSELLEFYNKVKSVRSQTTGPLLVHCSDGVGRTGTFITLDYLLEQAKQEQLVDVSACICKMRKNRCEMVQTADQYR